MCFECFSKDNFFKIFIFAYNLDKIFVWYEITKPVKVNLKNISNTLHKN